MANISVLFVAVETMCECFRKKLVNSARISVSSSTQSKCGVEVMGQVDRAESSVRDGRTGSVQDRLQLLEYGACLDRGDVGRHRIRIVVGHSCSALPYPIENIRVDRHDVLDSGIRVLGKSCVVNAIGDDYRRPIDGGAQVCGHPV